jgi:hypothetical protein
MNKYKFFAFGAAFLFALFMSACNIDGRTYDDFETFHYDLQGTWITNVPESEIYTGKLVIEYNSVSITGYGSIQTPIPGGDDNQRPFKAFTKGTALKAYSENGEMSNNARDGEIFIRNAGTLHDGIPYTYYTGGNGQDKFLKFTFAGMDQVLRKE